MPIPDAIEPAFNRLHDDLAYLYVRRQMFRELYGDEDTVHVLNEVAPFFFHEVQRTLLNEVILGLARLTDRSTTCGKDNLTLSALAEEIENLGDPAFAKTLGDQLSGVLESVSGIQSLRHTVLAHRDRQIALGGPTVQVSHDQLEEALARCAEFLNLVQAHYDEGMTAYDEVIVQSRGTVPELLGFLRRALDNRATGKKPPE